MPAEMKTLHDVWEGYSGLFSPSQPRQDQLSVDAIMASFFCSGPHYYYVMDFCDHQIQYMHPAIQDILGLAPSSTTLDDIIGRIHPDDMAFVVEAEKALCHFALEHIGFHNLMRYKSGFCFRLKTADGSYQLFQHQAIHLSVDSNGKLARGMNIHTNISHITNVNNYKASLVGILGEKGLYQFDMSTALLTAPARPAFTAREQEVVRLIAEGHKNEKIADLLSISLHTVKNHRKNIIRKAGVRNSSELIARCMNEALL